MLWLSLLVVRELLFGPQRFTDLQGRLPGIGTNQLATRLRELEHELLVAKRSLPPPAASTVYELTEQGHLLEPAIFALVRFGIPRLRTLSPVNTFRPAWAALALRASAGTGPLPERAWTWEVHVEGEVFHTTASRSGSTTRSGPRPDADVGAVIETDTITAFALLRGDLGTPDALAHKLLRTSHDAACIAWAKHSNIATD